MLRVLSTDPCIGKGNKVNTRTLDKPSFLHPQFSRDSDACFWRWQVLQDMNCFKYSCRRGVIETEKCPEYYNFFTSNVDLMILGCSPWAPYRNPYVQMPLNIHHSKYKLSVICRCPACIWSWFYEIIVRVCPCLKCLVS